MSLASDLYAQLRKFMGEIMAANQPKDFAVGKPSRLWSGPQNVPCPPDEYAMTTEGQQELEAHRYLTYYGYKKYKDANADELIAAINEGKGAMKLGHLLTSDAGKLPREYRATNHEALAERTVKDLREWVTAGHGLVDPFHQARYEGNLLPTEPEAFTPWLEDGNAICEVLDELHDVIREQQAIPSASRSSEAQESKYESAAWFTLRNIPADRLRHASASHRKTKIVDSRHEDGVKKYCVADVMKHWPDDLKDPPA